MKKPPTQVEIFYSTSVSPHEEVAKEINEFLRENDDFEVVDIKMSTYEDGISHPKITAMVIYR